MGTGDASEKDPADETFKNLMDLKECVKDSPQFRQQLHNREHEISDLETKLERVVGMCDRMVTTGNAYTETCRSFSVSLKDLAMHFTEGEVVAVTLKKFYEALSELQSFYSVLFDQTQKSVQACLRSYLSSELRKVKETKKSFHRVSEDLANAIHRNGHAPKSKVAEAEEASAHLVSMENQFSHSAVDYSYQINLITCNKSYEIMQSLLAYMRAQTTFFHEGYDWLRQFDPFMSMVETKVDVLEKRAQSIIQDMELRHTYVSPKRLEDSTQEEPYSSVENPTLPIEMSGYLFKKPRGNNPFKSWSRRWFILKTSKLIYQSESKGKEEENMTVAEDLRICTVKLAEEQERRFCFEVVTPTRSCILQADSEPLRKKWLCYLEAGISRALNISASNKKSEDLDDFRKRSMAVTKGTPISILNQSPNSARKNDSNYSLGIHFLEVPGNSACADCGSAKPTWASINLGVMLCIECSGIHRGMGVHISKVRSVTLDDWEPELQKIMCALGNTRVNAIYEYEIPYHTKKPTSESSRSARETFIRLKYVQHAFVHPHPDFTRPDAPVPPISISEMLAPASSARGSIGSSPKSPQKRSFSPGLKLRLLNKSVPRPSSASSNITDMSTPTGSEEDLRRADSNASIEAPTGLHALAENFRKQEEKKKSSGNAGGQLKPASWGAIGDKLKSARKSSKKISNYALNKLGEGQESIMKRLKKTGRDRASREILRETLSDTEEEPTKGNSSLLYSLSASTHNLSNRSSGRNKKKSTVPPPKPPRTFKQTKQDLNHDDDDGLGDVPLDFADDDNFSVDSITRLPSIGSNSLSIADDQSLINGLLPSTSSSSSLGLGAQYIPRSESSPQLSHNRLSRSESSNSNFLSESPRLQTISEDGSDANRLDGGELSNRTSSVVSPLPHASPVISPDTRLSNSVPLRRKLKANPQTAPKTSEDDSSISLSSAYCNSDSFAQFPLDIPLPKLESTPEPRNNSSMDNRMSFISVASAEYFSAESMDGGSKPNSASPSPEFQFGKGKLSLSPIPPPIAEGDTISSKEGDTTDIPGGVRVNSSLSIDDESFNTPPSSPCPSATPSPNMGRAAASLMVYNIKEGQAFGGMATLKAGQIISEDGVEIRKNSGHGGQTAPNGGVSNDDVDLSKQASNSTLKDYNAENALLKNDDNVVAAVDDTAGVTNESRKSSVSTVNGTVEVMKADEPVKRVELVEQESLVPEHIDECDGHVTISVVERSNSRGDETDSVFSASPTPTAVGASPAPVPPKRIKRRRSSTMSNSAFDTLPVRGSKNKLKQGEKPEAKSKDDNFGTEHKVHSESLVSAFSEKDYEDIFSSIVSKSGYQVQGGPEESESGGGKVAGNQEPSPEVEVEIGGQAMKLGEELKNGQAEEEDKLSVEEIVEEDLEDWTIIIPDSVHPSLFLYSSVSKADIPGVLCALAHGASANYNNEEEESRTPVLNAIQMGNKVMVEYLYQNGSKLTSTDKFGKGCLHYAATLDNASLVMMLLKRGANPAIKDNEGRDPISYALDQDQEDGDIITMLRMATFREESKSGDNKQSEYLEEQESEFFKDVEVASLVDSGRTSNRMSTPSIEGSISLDSK